eukprot:g9911.t1
MSLINPSLDFFSEPLSDESIESKEYQVYNPNDLGEYGTTKTRFEINIHPQDVFQNFSEARIETTVKIVKSDGTALDTGNDTENIALQNGFWSLWERAELRVGNGAASVESINFANVAAQMKFLTEASDDYKRTSGTNMGVYLDSGDGAASSANTGWNSRFELAKASNSITYYAPLKHLFGYCTNGKVTRGLKHTVILTRASHPNMIHVDGAATAGSKVFIENVRIWCPTVVPSLEVIQNYENKMLEGFSQKINFESMNCYRSGVFQASDQTPVYRVTTAIANPTALIIGVQASATDNSETANNQIFLNTRMTEFEVRLNNTQIPREKLITSYKNPKNYGRAYQMLQDYNNKFGDSQSGSCVNLAEFESIYNLLVVDLKHVPPMVFNTNNSADIEIRLRRDGTGGGYTSPAIHIYCLRGRKRKVGRPLGSKNKKGRKKTGKGLGSLAIKGAKTFGPPIVAGLLSELILKNLKKGKGSFGRGLQGKKNDNILIDLLEDKL